MILDTLDHLNLYRNIHPDLPAAVKLLQAFSAGEIVREPGRYELEGTEAFYLVQTYAPRNQADALWEAHRKYTDLQFIAAGKELMGYQRLDRLVTTTPYDEQKDAEMLVGEGTFFPVEAGMFCLFFPQDAHMPSLQTAAGPDAQGTDENVVKVVVKLPVL